MTALRKRIENGIFGDPLKWIRHERIFGDAPLPPVVLTKDEFVAIVNELTEANIMPSFIYPASNEIIRYE